MNMHAVRDHQRIKRTLVENSLLERDPSLINLPIPIPSIPILGPILTGLIGGEATTTSTTATATPTPTTTTPSAPQTSASSSSDSGNGGSNGNGSGSEGGSSVNGDFSFIPSRDVWAKNLTGPHLSRR